MNDVATPDAILAFWQDAGPDKWFNKSDAFDQDISTQFLKTYEAAASGKLMDWADAPQRALALLIVLDQFPRNMFRGDARSWVADPLAREVAKAAVANGFDRQIDHDLRAFMYLPFMHSENLSDQETCVGLYRVLGNANNLKYAELHEDIIRRFGRFPHRNAVLGRSTTPEEKTFLESGGFGG